MSSSWVVERLWPGAYFSFPWHLDSGQRCKLDERRDWAGLSVSAHASRDGRRPHCTYTRAFTLSRCSI
jgi:hypothetical protein